MKKPSPRVLSSALFVIIALVTITNWHLIVSLAVTLSADGTNESLYLNPTGTGKVVVGGDSLVLATKTSAPGSPETGQVYFDSTTGTFRGYTGSDWVNLSEPVPSVPPFPTTGLVSYWKMDESSGNVADAHGSNTLSPVGTIGSTSGKISNARGTFGTSNNYFDATDIDSLDIARTSSWSTSFWAYTTATGGRPQNKYDNQVSEQDGWMTNFVNSGGAQTIRWNLSGVGGNNNIQVQTTTTFSLNAWHHIAITYDGSGAASGVHIYIDGTEASITVQDDSLGSTTTTNTENLHIGNTDYGAWSNPVPGYLDEMGIWSRALSAQEVENLYNGGAGLSY